jgi:hypothetical protein
MGEILSGRQQASNNISDSNFSSKQTGIGVVYDIILDDTHELIKKGKATVADIGSVAYRLLDDYSVSAKDLSYAFPYENSSVKTIPVINELVEIIVNDIGAFYKKIQPGDGPNNSATINYISTKFEVDNNSDVESNTDASTVYRESTITKIPKPSKSSKSSKYNKFGNYFQFTPNVHRLKLYEGDSLLESRFGQSLRFSAYNNVKKSFSPVTILRNGESSINRQLEPTVTVDDDVNTDGSIILMGSNDYQLAFQPGTVDNKGSSDFETKPDSFNNYPTKLIGNQLLLNSGRIILSAKTAEMIFYSKKNYGFISDGAMSIDNKLGIDVSVGGNINVITNDRDVAFFTGNGSIFLGDTDREPMVKGNKLVDLLADLLAAILNQQYLTPSGPTALGPENFNEFIDINNRLQEILSSKNQTS